MCFNIVLKGEKNVCEQCAYASMIKWGVWCGVGVGELIHRAKIFQAP